MSKKAIDNGVDNLSTLDPTVVLEMLSRVPPPLINQLAEAQGVKTYIIKSVIMEAKKMAELQIEERKEEKKESSSGSTEEISGASGAADSSADKNLAGDILDE